MEIPEVGFAFVCGMPCSSSTTQQEYGFSVLFGEKNPYDRIIEELSTIVLSFKEVEGHATADSAIATLVHVCLKRKESVLVDIVNSLVNDEKYKQINLETNGENWDLPVHYRIHQIVTNIRKTLWENNVDKNEKSNTIEKIGEILKQDEVLYWQNITSLRVSLIDFSNAKEVENLLQVLVKDLLQGDNIVYSSLVITSLTAVLTQDGIENAGWSEHVVTGVVEKVLSEHNSNKDASSETKMWERLAALLQRLSSESKWNDTVKNLMLELRSRKANSLLQATVMTPK
jgi:hypothetical protein